MSHFELLMNDDGIHRLLEPSSPAYTNLTVRRAFIVWLHYGQRDEFRNVCNYYHYLEKLEDTWTADARARSRMHELSLMYHPPFSNYLATNFPNVYRQNKYNKINVTYVKDEGKLEDSVFNLEGYHDLKIQRGVRTKEIVQTSQMIRTYCKVHYTSLRKLLAEFQDFVKKTEAKNSVDNISMFIKKQYLKDELVIWKNMPQHFTFLDTVDDTNVVEVGSKVGTVYPNKSQTLNLGNSNDPKIRILKNDTRKHDLANILPQMTDLSIKDCKNNKCSNQNFVSSKITEKAYKKKPIDEFKFVNKI